MISPPPKFPMNAKVIGVFVIMLKILVQRVLLSNFCQCLRRITKQGYKPNCLSASGFGLLTEL